MNFRPLMGNFEGQNSLILGSVFLYWLCFPITVTFVSYLRVDGHDEFDELDVLTASTSSIRVHNGL